MLEPDLTTARERRPVFAPVAAQLAVALARLPARAFPLDRSTFDVPAGVVVRRLRFT